MDFLMARRAKGRQIFGSIITNTTSLNDVMNL